MIILEKKSRMQLMRSKRQEPQMRRHAGAEALLDKKLQQEMMGLGLF